jgi:hypothetical protein
MFATGNIIRVRVNENYSFYQCAADVSERLNGALKNQELMVSPRDSRTIKSRYDFIVRRPITCESWIDVDCALFSGLYTERAIIAHDKSEHALRLIVINSGSQLSLLFQYNLDLFDGTNIRIIAARTENIMKEIITNPSGNMSGT